MRRHLAETVDQVKVVGEIAWAMVREFDHAQHVPADRERHGEMGLVTPAFQRGTRGVVEPRVVQRSHRHDRAGLDRTPAARIARQRRHDAAPFGLETAVVIAHQGAQGVALQRVDVGDRRAGDLREPLRDGVEDVVCAEAGRVLEARLDHQGKIAIASPKAGERIFAAESRREQTGHHRGDTSGDGVIDRAGRSQLEDADEAVPEHDRSQDQPEEASPVQEPFCAAVALFLSGDRHGRSGHQLTGHRREVLQAPRPVACEVAATGVVGQIGCDQAVLDAVQGAGVRPFRDSLQDTCCPVVAAGVTGGRLALVLHAVARGDQEALRFGRTSRRVITCAERQSARRIFVGRDVVDEETRSVAGGEFCEGDVGAAEGARRARLDELEHGPDAAAGDHRDGEQRRLAEPSVRFRRVAWEGRGCGEIAHGQATPGTQDLDRGRAGGRFAGSRTTAFAASAEATLAQHHGAVLAVGDGDPASVDSEGRCGEVDQRQEGGAEVVQALRPRVRAEVDSP